MRGVGVEWVRTIRTYDMKQTMGVLREALLTKFTRTQDRSLRKANVN